MKNQLVFNKTIFLNPKDASDKKHIIWWPWVLIVITLLGFASISLYQLSEGSFSRDHYWQCQLKLFVWSNTWLQEMLPTRLWANLTKAGDALVLLPILALVSIRHRQAWSALLFTTPIAGLSSILLKNWAAIPRPGGIIEQEGWEAIGPLLTGFNSLPSGHALCAFAAFSAFLLARYPQGKWPIVALGLTTASIIALSRVAVGAHWPLDIVFGAAIGSAAGLCGALIALHTNQVPVGAKARVASVAILTIFALALVREISMSQNTEAVVYLALSACLLCCLHLLLEGLVSIRITILRHSL